MENQQQIVKEEMRKLIKKSCQHPNIEGSNYYNFQKSLLKFYFGAVDASIDFDEGIIFLANSKPRTLREMNLYDINEAVATKVAFNNLEETLKGCIQDGEMPNRFYRTMLFHYNNVSDPEPMQESA